MRLPCSLDQLLLFSSIVFFLPLSLLFLMLHIVYDPTHVMMLTRIQTRCCCVVLYDDRNSMLKRKKRKKYDGIENSRRKSSINSARMHPCYFNDDSGKAFVLDPDPSYSSIHRINMRKKISMCHKSL
jgi:hypothetical protein